MEEIKTEKTKPLFKFNNAILLFLLVISLAVFGIVANSIVSDRKITDDDAAVADVEPASLYVLRREPIVTSLGNNEYEIEITFFVRNNNSKEVIDIAGTSSVQFAGNYTLISKTSDNLTLNTAYDSKSSNSLLATGQNLAPGESSNLTYKFRASSSTLNGLSQFAMSMSIGGSVVVPPPPTDNGGNSGSGNNGGNPTDPVITPDPVDIETNLTPRNFQFRLMNVDTGEIMGFVNEGDEIDVSKLASRNFTIEAIPNVAVNGSVKFGLNGNANFKNENNPDFVMTGNNGSLYNKWNYALGNQVLSATGYAARGGAGTSLGGTTINFVLIDSNPSSAGNGNGTNTNNGSADVAVDLDFDNQDDVVPTEEEPVTPDETEVVASSGGQPTLPNTGIEMPNILYIGFGIISILATLELLTFVSRNKISE